MKKIFIALMLCALCGSLQAQGYEIGIKIKSIPGDTVILGHHFNERLIPDDTVKLDSKGFGVFKGKKKLPGGMYFIFMPNRNYFDILIDDNQKFTIENDTTPAKFLDNMVITGDLQNQLFVDYQKFLGKCRTDYEKAKTDDEKNAINQRVEDHYKEQITKYPDMFFSKFLTATRDVAIPASITDQNERYFYYKAHYFDNFPVSDGRLLRTALYEPKIKQYIDNIVIQMPDSLIKETNWLVNATRPKGKLVKGENDELFRFMLVYFFNKYAKSEAMVAENVYCSLAEIYVKDAVWDTDSFKTELKKKITKKENCLVGNISKNLVLKQLPDDTTKINALRPFTEVLKTEGVEIETKKPDFEARRNDVVRILDDLIGHFGGYIDMHKTPAKYTLIVFWEPDCSHCKEEIPKLFKFYQDTLKNEGVKVWAVYMNRSVDKLGDLHRHINKWFDFIKEKHLMAPGWINCWNPFDQYRDNYDVNSTPTFYLLDEKKEIIAKRIGHEQAYELIRMIEDDKAKRGEKK
ncbi:MAG: DUF5106 domain-containing protein [Bacteroidales bacterium]|nr:DUF5106 domain-containing protein [Bacteroidales bacterium]